VLQEQGNVFSSWRQDIRDTADMAPI
jgi:hypothetical protein